MTLLTEKYILFPPPVRPNPDQASSEVVPADLSLPLQRQVTNKKIKTSPTPGDIRLDWQCSAVCTILKLIFLQFNTETFKYHWDI